MKGQLKNILYIEDEIDIQTIAKFALEEVGGYKVTVFSSGQEGVEKALILKPDLILLDVMMPEMDGPTTLKKLRETPVGKDIPIIFMTAKVQKEEIQKLKELGVLDVIAKPFEPMTLSDEVLGIWENN